MAMVEYQPAVLACARRAQLEAQRLGFPFVQREQLFLGLLDDETVGRILLSLRLDLNLVRASIEERLLPGLGAPEDPTEIGMLPTAEQVFRQRAQTASAVMGHTHIGTEHILLGFLLEQHGVVLEVLTAMDVTAETVKNAIGQLHKQGG
jgi:ATP-dependent Clp protease ATP-binding subunit ClpA